MPNKLQAISILVPDYAEGISFFCNVLGFDLIEDLPQGDKRWVRVAPKGGQTSIILARASTLQQIETIGNQGGGRVWLFLETDDFSRDYTDFKAKGVFFEEAPRDEPYGTVAVFRDPFGNRWDLLEPKAER